MDYSMESLTVGDVRVCDDKFPVQSSSYDGTSLDNRERLIQESQAYKSNQHEMNLMDASPPLHITINSHIPRIIGGKDSDIPRQYAIAENVCPARGEMRADFDRSILCNGNSKIRGHERDVYKEGASNGQSYVYCNKSGLMQGNMGVQHEDSLGRYPVNSVGVGRSVDNVADLKQEYMSVKLEDSWRRYWLNSVRSVDNMADLKQENMSVEHVDSLGRYPLNSVGVARSVDNMADLRQEKVTSARCDNNEPAISDFVPQTSQNKEQYYLIISSDRSSHEAVQDSTVQCHGSAQEGRSGYTQMMSQQAHFSDIDFQRAEHFNKTQEAGNMLCLENSSTQSELYCPSNDVVDISKRQNGETGFESGSNVSKETREPSVFVDGDFCEQKEDASAVEALMILQGESRATHGTESIRVPVLTSNEVDESCAKLQDVSESHKGDSSDQNYLSNSDSVSGPDLQTVNAKRRIKMQGRKNALKSKKRHASDDVDNSTKTLAKLLRKSESKFKEDDIVQLRSVDEVDKKGKRKMRTRGFNGESKLVGQDMVSNCKEEKDNKNTDEPQAMPSITDRNKLLSEDDAVSVQSVDSPPVDKKKKFKCKLCKRTWKFRKDLNKHMKTHAATKKFTCSVCSSGFINRTLLKKHLLTHSDILFPCPECSVSCKSLVELKSHQQIHARAEIFSCSECSFTAKRQKHLARHMLVHSDVKVYHCQFCKFSSKRKYSLQRHVKTAHSSAETHECSVCDFNTNAVDSFKVHIAMHASTQTTSCIICGVVIKKRPNLIEHLLSHSKDEDTTCKECGETCTTSHEYILHLLNHKDLSSASLEGVSQDSVFDLNSPPLNGSVDSTSGMFGFLARKNKVIMDTPTMEAKLAQMSTVASRLADMTKVITLLNEKSKVVFQLAEVSTLATELAVISGNVLQSYKNTYGVAEDATTAKAKTPPSSNDATDDSSIEDDDYETLPELSISPAKIKEELQEHAYPSTEADMQIQVDLNGTAVSCVQNDDLFKLEVAPTSKGTKVLKCSRCSMTFNDSRSLKRHLLAHDNVRPYYCECCGMSFRRNEHLKKHMVTHSDERPFTCKDCPYAAKTEHRLKIHALCHSQTKAYACQRCAYTARTNYELNNHMKRHDPRSCSQCSFVCYSRAELKKHVFTHSSFDCNECDFTTNDRAEYTKHMKKHSLVQHLCCELCGYSCDTMKKFKYHKLRHDNKTPYQCQDCDYRCSSRASFDCHRLKHAGLKPYLCSVCGASFRKTSHLNQHLLIHKDEKSFKCSECNYSCRTKHNLKEHEMTHSGEKPFSCKYCSFSCRRNKALTLHLLKHESSGMLISSLQMPSIGYTNLQLALQMSMTPS